MQLDSEPKRLSPLHNQHQSANASLNLWDGWLIPEIYTSLANEKTALRERVGLGDISNRGKLNLKGDKVDGIVIASFGATPTNRGDVIVIKSSQGLVAKLTPDEFLILTLPGGEKELTDSLKTEISSHNAFASVIDQTSGMVGLLISGPMSTGVMSKLCALDFSSIKFPDLHVAQSSFAKVRTTIVRRDRGDTPSFEFYADRSYADYLWNAILDAGKEFEILPVGWKSVEL